jgi:hypothetical protein
MALDSLVALARERQQLDVTANLSVTVDGRAFAVSTTEERVVVHAPSVGGCLTLLPRVGRLPSVAATLDAAGVTVELRTGTAVLAVVGRQASPGRLTASLFSDAVEVRGCDVFAGLVRAK